MNVFDKPEYWCGNIGYRPPGYGDFTVNTVKEIAILLHKPSSVLDIGCAYGFTVIRLNMLGIPAIGLDCSQYALSKVPDAFKKHFFLGDVCDMPFENKSIDLAFSSGVLEHIPKGKLKKAISEIIRVCRRGLIAVSCSDDPSTYKGADDTHEVSFSRAEWQKQFPPEFQIISDSERVWRSYVTYMVTKIMGYKAL